MSKLQEFLHQNLPRIYCYTPGGILIDRYLDFRADHQALLISFMATGEQVINSLTLILPGLAKLSYQLQTEHRIWKEKCASQPWFRKQTEAASAPYQRHIFSHNSPVSQELFKLTHVQNNVKNALGTLQQAQGLYIEVAGVLKAMSNVLNILPLKARQGKAIDVGSLIPHLIAQKSQMMNLQRASTQLKKRFAQRETM